LAVSKLARFLDPNSDDMGSKTMREGRFGKIWGAPFSTQQQVMLESTRDMNSNYWTWVGVMILNNSGSIERTVASAEAE
jgi:hypothetical protein